jgi:hypothetical protein
MAGKTGKSPPPAKAADRDQRLKAALKANLARRKAQARARADRTGPQAGDGGENPSKG